MQGCLGALLLGLQQVYSKEELRISVAVWLVGFPVGSLPRYREAMLTHMDQYIKLSMLSVSFICHPKSYFVYPKTSANTMTSAEYILANEEEIKRLSSQHPGIKQAMEGLLFAPLDCRSGPVKILERYHISCEGYLSYGS
jgi:hypothetical protein